MTVEAAMAEHALNIPYSDDLLLSLKESPEEFEAEARLLLAVKLYELGRLSTGRAAGLAGMDRVEFLFALRRFGVSPGRRRARGAGAGPRECPPVTGLWSSIRPRSSPSRSPVVSISSRPSISRCLESGYENRRALRTGHTHGIGQVGQNGRRSPSS
jgi:predicted HTH domain antitoxin